MTESRLRQSATFRSHAYRWSPQHGSREFKIIKKKKNNNHKIYTHTHSYLFIIFRLMLPLSIFLARHAIPTPSILWLVLLRLKQPHFLSFSCQIFFFYIFFTYNTKLLGIIPVCVRLRGKPCRKLSTSFKWEEKVGQGESREAMYECVHVYMRVCVCACVFACMQHASSFWAHYIVKERLWFIEKRNGEKKINQRDARCPWSQHSASNPGLPL